MVDAGWLLLLVVLATGGVGTVVVGADVGTDGFVLVVVLVGFDIC